MVMRWLLLLAIALGLLVGLAGRGQAQEEPRALVEKAIKAHGGEELLTRQKAGQLKTKGTLEVAGGLAITQEITYLLPDKFKENVEFEVNGQKIQVSSVFNGSKGSIKANGQDVPVDDKILAEF
jgi:hypothetical protein